MEEFQIAGLFEEVRAPAVTAEDIEQVSQPAVADSLVSLVLGINQTDQLETLDRLTQVSQVTRGMRKYGVRRDPCECLISVLCSSGRLINVRALADGPRGSLVVNERANVRMILALVTDAMQKKYFEIMRRPLGVSAIVSVYENSPNRLPRHGHNAELLTSYIASYLELDAAAKNDPASPEEVRIRERRLWDEMAARVRRASSTRVGEPTGLPVRRAIDEPKWQEFAKKQGPDISWDMVIQNFGAQMMIRIVLRRQHYQSLLALIKQNSSMSDFDLQYAADSLQKIETHNDVGSGKRAEFDSLREYLASRGFTAAT